MVRPCFALVHGVVGFFVLKVPRLFFVLLWLMGLCGYILSLIICRFEIHLHHEDSATPVYPVQLLSAVLLPNFSGFLVQWVENYFAAALFLMLIRFLKKVFIDWNTCQARARFSFQIWYAFTNIWLMFVKLIQLYFPIPYLLPEVEN